MLKSLIVKAIVLPAVGGGAWLAGHGDLPTLPTDATPPAAPAPAAQLPAAGPEVPAGGMVVVVVTDEDGKTVTYQVPAGQAGRAPARKEAAPLPTTAASPTATRTSIEGRSVATVAPQPDTSSAAPTSSAAAPTAAPTAAPAFTNCAAVRAAGKAPIHRGDPGWTDKLDRNGDGVACG